jgi:hypothetical protein
MTEMTAKSDLLRESAEQLPTSFPGKALCEQSVADWFYGQPVDDL